MKMKHRNAVGFFLSAAMLTAGLASCGNSETDVPKGTDAEGKKETEAESELMTDGLEDVDMEQWEFRVLNPSEDSLSWANNVVTVDRLNGDILNDAIYDRNSALSDRFNMKIMAENIDYGDIPGKMRELVLAGDPFYDVYAVSEAHVQQVVEYAADWNTVPVIRLSEPWWNPDATSVFNIFDKQIAVAGNMTLTAVSRAVSIVFNKNIWRTYGDPDMNLYDLVLNGQWTVDKFLETAKSVHADKNGDGVMNENDLYGLHMGRGFKGYVGSFLAASGMSYTEKKDDGTYTFTLHENERGLGLVTKLMDAFKYEGYMYNDSENSSGAGSGDMFKNSHMLFTEAVPNDIYRLRDMNDDIGILPMPKYDESQQDFHAPAYGGAVWFLPQTYQEDRIEWLGTFMEALTFATYRDVIPVYKEIALKTKSTRDNESSEMLDIIFDSICFDFGMNIMYDAVYTWTFLDELWKIRDSGSLVSTLQKHVGYIVGKEDALYEMIANME